MSTPADRHRERIRATLRKVDPGMLAFLDAARGVFGEKTRLTQLEVKLPDGRTVDLRKDTPPEPTP